MDKLELKLLHDCRDPSIPPQGARCDHRTQGDERVHSSHAATAIDAD